MIRLQKQDIGKFAFYFLLFSGLLFAGEKTLSSDRISTYDSASIRNVEQMENDFLFSDHKTSTLSGTSIDALKIDTSATAVSRKQPTPGRLTFVFHPDAVSLDTNLIDLVRANVDASEFRDKISNISITLDGERQEPRGQLTGNNLILTAHMPSDSETTKVLVHELGHVIDIQYLRGNSFRKDPSEEFYAISWDSSSVKKTSAKLSDFVSGYALSNKYEDFAESFTFFVFHNSAFLSRASKSSALMEKYEFFRNQIFSNTEFENTSFEESGIPNYLWDTTKILVDSKKYLFYIK